MLSFFIILLLLIIFGWFVPVYRHKSKEKKDLFILKKSRISELINEIKDSRFDIIFSISAPPASSVILSLFEVRHYLENKRELSLSKYNLNKIYLTDNYNQIINFKKYLNDPLIPEEIKIELKKFHNSRYSPVNPMHTYFILITANDLEDENYEGKSDGLFFGDGEAFASWELFKECSRNLSYVMEQWIRDNCDLIDGDIYLELVEVSN